MKKCNESFDFLALTNTLDKCKDVDEGAEKLAKRFWLRNELYEYYGASYMNELEEAFKWIYNAPIYYWEGMLRCLTYHDNKTYPKPLEDAKKLFGLLR